MLLGNRAHLLAHRVVGYQNVTEHDEEHVITGLWRGDMHGMPQSKRLVLVHELHGKRARMLDGIGICVLAHTA